MKWNYYLLLLLPLGIKAQHSQQHVVDSLVNRLQTTSEDTTRVRLLDNISFTYTDIDPDKGIMYGQQALKLAQHIGWPEGMAAAYSDLAINHEAKSNHFIAIRFNMRALEIYRLLNRKVSMAGIMANLSSIYRAQSDYPKALEYGFKALKIQEELGDEHTVAIILENIGTIFLEQKNYPKTTEYYTKAFKTYEKLDNQAGMARNLGNSGIVEDARGNYSLALQYHLQALETNRLRGTRYSIQINMANVGIVYSHMGNYVKALEYQLEALNISNELGNKISIAINLGNIGETYLFFVKNTYPVIDPSVALPGGKEANIKHAISYLERATSLCKEVNFIAPMIEFGQYLSEAYHLAGLHVKALEVFKSAEVYKDSIFSQQSQIKLADLEAERELDLRERDIIIKNKQLEIAELEAANKRIERTVYIIVIAILVLFMALAIRKFLKRIKVQRTALDDIAGIHAHAIRGPVARILGLTQVFNYDKPEDPVNVEVISAIRTVSQQLDEIVKEVVHKTETSN